MRNLAHLFDRRAHVVLPKECGAGDKRVRARPSAFRDGGIIDSAIHFEPILQRLFTTPRIGLLNLWEAFVNETLSAEAGIHRHHQQQINLIEKRLHSGDAGGRIHGEPNLFAERTDFPQQRRHAIAEFDVNDDLISPGFDKGFE